MFSETCQQVCLHGDSKSSQVNNEDETLQLSLTLKHITLNHNIILFSPKASFSTHDAEFISRSWKSQWSSPAWTMLKGLKSILPLKTNFLTVSPSPINHRINIPIPKGRKESMKIKAKQVAQQGKQQTLQQHAWHLRLLMDSSGFQNSYMPLWVLLPAAHIATFRVAPPHACSFLQWRVMVLPSPTYWGLHYNFGFNLKSSSRILSGTRNRDSSPTTHCLGS